MSNEFELAAELRSDTGKGASRRLRHQELVPAIMYGGGEDPVNLTFEHRHLVKATENDAFYSHILTIKVADKKQKVVLKDLQRHPSKRRIMHLDLLRVSMKDTITMHVPLHFINEEEAPGVKEGGIVSHNMVDVEVKCAAGKLPEAIDVDLKDLALDSALHLSDLVLPKGVEIVALTHGADHDLPVATIHLPRAAKEDEALDAKEAVAQAAAAEPASDADTSAEGETSEKDAE